MKLLRWIKANDAEVVLGVSIVVSLVAIVACVVAVFRQELECSARGGYMVQVGTTIVFVNAGNNVQVPIQVPITECRP